MIRAAPEESRGGPINYSDGDWAGQQGEMTTQRGW
jgi:hypothetical protein